MKLRTSHFNHLVVLLILVFAHYNQADVYNYPETASGGVENENKKELTESKNSIHDSDSTAKCNLRVWHADLLKSMETSLSCIYNDEDLSDAGKLAKRGINLRKCYNDYMKKLKQFIKKHGSDVKNCLQRKKKIEKSKKPEKKNKKQQYDADTYNSETNYSITTEKPLPSSTLNFDSLKDEITSNNIDSKVYEGSGTVKRRSLRSAEENAELNESEVRAENTPAEMTRANTNTTTGSVRSETMNEEGVNRANVPESTAATLRKLTTTSDNSKQAAEREENVGEGKTNDVATYAAAPGAIGWTTMAKQTNKLKEDTKEVKTLEMNPLSLNGGATTWTQIFGFFYTITEKSKNGMEQSPYPKFHRKKARNWINNYKRNVRYWPPAHHSSKKYWAKKHKQHKGKIHKEYASKKWKNKSNSILFPLFRKEKPHHKFHFYNKKVQPSIHAYYSSSCEDDDSCDEKYSFDNLKFDYLPHRNTVSGKRVSTPTSLAFSEE